MSKHRVIIEKDVKSLFNKREKDCNKGNFGYVGVMGGCPSYSGAVKLANMSNCSIKTLVELSMAALRSGCGVSKLIVPKSISTSVSPYLLESTLYEMPVNEYGFMILSENDKKEAFNKLKSLSVGMGWGQSDTYFDILKYLLNELNLNLIIDADGLNMLSKMPEYSKNMRISDGLIQEESDKNIVQSSSCNIVMTPHLMEFSRLSGHSIEQIKADRITLAKLYANKYHVILLLKGAETIVTDGDSVIICDRGTPGMSTAGSGDVLSGILTGLLGYLPYSVETVAAGAYINGLAGELAAKEYTEISMTAGDTVKMIPNAMKMILGR